MDIHADRERIRMACAGKTAVLRDGTKIPRLGQGTWHMGGDPEKKRTEIEALRTGIELGMTLIDTAEMYGEGASERLVGEAVRGYPRERLFLVSKVLPDNAGKARIFQSCENSLRRLGVDALDLYLLHWRGGVPLAETVECMEELIRRGKIRRWGVSNFDAADMKELWDVPGGERCSADQVLYHLGSRGIEYDLLPFLREKGVPVMAYCPLAQGGSLRTGLMNHPAVKATAQENHASCAQILLAFLLHNGGVIAIPKSGSPGHTLENAASSLINLSDGDMARLSDAFPAPARKTALDIV